MKTPSFLLSILITTACLSFFACTKKNNELSSAQPKETSQQIIKDYEIRDLNRVPQSTMKEIGQHTITVLDIWASWCGPCMREMPNLVALHKKYANRGLGIIGISLDKDYNSWKQAVESQYMTWLQLSELRGWDCSIVQDNGIDAIPHTIVVDSCGHILQTGLRGTELEEFVCQQLNVLPEQGSQSAK